MSFCLLWSEEEPEPSDSDDDTLISYRVLEHAATGNRYVLDRANNEYHPIATQDMFRSWGSESEVEILAEFS